MLVGRDAESFETVAVLNLSGGLLKLLVGDKELQGFATNRHAEAIVVAEVAVVPAGKIRSRRGVGEIFEHRRIQITIRERSVSAEAESVFSPLILHEQIGIG